jgi:predicted PolB exonuclease-like 3'-5' exonuclease
MGDNYPTALLYGALLEAATYLKSDAETITNYSQRYNQTMEELMRLGEGKNTRDAYRSGQARIPVKGSRGPA